MAPGCNGADAPAPPEVASVSLWDWEDVTAGGPLLGCSSAGGLVRPWWWAVGGVH